MKISVYAICYNEEKMLPFFLDHYSSFCDEITIYDNESTDRSIEIINNFKKCKVNLETYCTNNQIDDERYLVIKNNCWKESDSDYVIVCDIDELIYHPDIKHHLKETNQPIYRPLAYNMVSDFFPVEGEPITSQIKEGTVEWYYSKPAVFSPKLVEWVNYDSGSHNADFGLKDGSQMRLSNSQIDHCLKLLHYKNLTFEYRYERHRLFAGRLSQRNYETHSGFHYLEPEWMQLEKFNFIKDNKSQIID